MGVLKLMPQPEAFTNQPPIINDFSLVVATANGTGSQTSNMAILRAIFKMGVPVNGKNIFPSNIQGLPTWYHIRVSKDGYVARRHTSEILVAFNQATVYEDIKNVPPGGVCIYNADWREMPKRDDLTMYGIPVNQFIRDSEMKGKQKDYLANMVYVGAVAHLLHIPVEKLEEALTVHFKGKRKPIEANMTVLSAAFAWARENLPKQDPYQVQPMNETAGKIIVTGNEAAALGTIFGGVSFVAWYPITPSTSLVDGINEYLPRFRKTADGKNSCVVIQAEDELAAAGMILGAGWAGARAMTSTSGPGISLMAESVSLGYFAEVPAVIWDIQRVGPSTGLPTRTSQGDVLFAYYLGHGDTKNVMLLPASVQECFDFGTTSLNLAEQLQTPVFVLSDLDLGMNNWMTDPFVYPSEPIQRGKVLTAEAVQEKGFARYKDIDGDAIPYRTLPGNPNIGAAYFTRGSGHNEKAIYTESSEELTNLMNRLARKFETARKMVPGPVVDEVAGAEIGIIAYGTTCYAIEEARDRLAAQGVKTSFMRLRALPINDEVSEFINRHDRCYVVELNRDGQMHTILQAELPAQTNKLRSLAILDGMPLTARWVVENLSAAEEL